jgi:phosphoserine phosphatase RsbU/P
LRLRLWRAESGELRLVSGEEPGWQPALPNADGPVATPLGERWFGGLAGTELWLEAPPISRPDALQALVSALLRADRATTYLSAELATRYQEIDLLYTISEVLGHTLRLDQAAGTIVRAVAEVVGARGATIAVLDEEAGLLRTVATKGLDATLAADVRLDDPVALSARVVREGGQLSEAVLSVPICYTPPGAASRCIGVITLTDRLNGGRFSAADQKLVSAAANQIAAGIELARLVVKEREQQRLADELELARDLQLLLLPAPNVLRGDAQVAVRCIPTERVGGDFYTFNRLGLGVVAVMLGDVASHGFAAALVMAAVMAAAGIHASSGATPDVTLRALRDSLAERLASSDTYLTVFYGILDPGRARLSWASAGHPYAFRIPAAGAPERLDATAPPLGLGGAAGEIGLSSVAWQKGSDLLCVWTDGLLDVEDASGERFGEARLLAALSSRRDQEPERIVAEVMAEVDAFSAKSGDDRTLLVLRL